MKNQRFRLRQVFWLDLNKPDEAELAETIEILKAQRTFASTIREGIQLVRSLKSGQLDVLLDRFPWIEEAFYQRFVGHESLPESAIHEQLARLERLLLEQGNTGIAMSTGPKPLNVPQIAGPQFEDANDLIVVKKAKSNGQSAQNFLDSAFSLIQ
jgi:hypothetical protein